MNTGLFQQGVWVAPGVLFNVIVRHDNENIRISGKEYKKGERIVPLTVADHPPCLDARALFDSWKQRYPECAASFDELLCNAQRECQWNASARL